MLPTIQTPKSGFNDWVSSTFLLNMSEALKILIYGSGAVGLGVGSCLLRSGAKVDFIAREKTRSALRHEGLYRTGIFGTHHSSPEQFGCYESIESLSSYNYDFVLVCTKTFDSAIAARSIASCNSLLQRSTKLILLQNGWGSTELFAARIPSNRLYNARVITGFTRPKPNAVEITVHADAISIGTLFDAPLSEVEVLANQISNGGIPTKVNVEVSKDLWAKMLYNCSLNPLGAILHLPYGALAEEQHSKSMLSGIITEVFEVMSAAGFHTHWETANDFLEIFYGRLVPATACHESSMLQDIRALKRTEIDALNGAVVSLAQEFSVPCPINEFVYHTVKSLEARNAAQHQHEPYASTPT